MVSILADTGPLVALINADDPWHQRCLAVAPALGRPLLTTWPVLTEASFLLGGRGGWRAQNRLWTMAARGGLEVAAPSDDAFTRIGELMGKYANMPMSLADASLVALAEERGQRRIFTVDSDFRIYRFKGGRAFEIVP